MNGQRIPRTPIVVDYWNLGKVPPRCLFFLTHMHAGRFQKMVAELENLVS